MNEIAGTITLSFQDSGEVRVAGQCEEWASEAAQSVFTQWAKVISMVANEMGSIEGRFEGTDEDGDDVAISI